MPQLFLRCSRRKQTGVPVSIACQRRLRRSWLRKTRIGAGLARLASSLGVLSELFPPVQDRQFTFLRGVLEGLATERLQAAIAVRTPANGHFTQGCFLQRTESVA